MRELYEQIGPDAALDYAKWTSWGARQTMPQALAILTNTYMPKRRQYLYVTQRNIIPAAMPNDAVINFTRFDPNPVSGTQANLSVVGAARGYVIVQPPAPAGSLGPSWTPATDDDRVWKFVTDARAGLTPSRVSH